MSVVAENKSDDAEAEDRQQTPAHWFIATLIIVIVVALVATLIGLTFLPETTAALAGR